MIDDTALNYTMAGDIPKGSTGRLSVQGLWRAGPGTRTLKVRSANYGDSLPIRVEPNEGNVLNLRLEEGSGTTTADSSGRANHGTLANGPVWVEGRFGQALQFDGSDDHVNVSNERDFDLTERVTVAAWIRTTATDKTNRRVVSKYFCCDAGPSSNVGYELNYHGAGDWVGWQVRFLPTESIGVNKTGLKINDNRWHHVAASYNRVEARLYVDGVFAGSVSNSTAIGTTDTNLVIGARGGLANLNFNGVIDEVLVYDRAYEPDELYVMRG